MWHACRPETRIAVVAHAGFIRHTLSAFAPELPPANQAELTREFLNCEMRTVVLSDTGIHAPEDPTAFLGGRQCLDGVTVAAHSSAV